MIKNLGIFLFLFFCVGFLISGQSATSDIHGTVVLKDGVGIAGVKVILSGTLPFDKETVTIKAGTYRFLNIPPGTYELTFQKEGFEPVTQKNIRLFVGKGKQINVKFVKGEKTKVSIMDFNLRSALVSTSLIREKIAYLPVPRDIWSQLEQVPGLILDRQDVGGNESGDFSIFEGAGVSRTSTTWNIDGVNISQPDTVGTAPVFANVNTYQEIQVTTAVNDIGAQTGGTQLNFVTRKGGNKLAGDSYLYLSNDILEMSHKAPDLYSGKDYGTPGLSHLYHLGANYGGPIIKDKLWFFGSFAIQDIKSRDFNNTEDSTSITSIYAKGNLNLSKNNDIEFLLMKNTKSKKGVASLGSENQSESSTWDETGPSTIFIGSISHVMGDLMLNAKFNYMDGGFTLDPQANSSGWMQEGGTGADMYVYGYPRTTWTGNNYYQTTDRNSFNFKVDGNYFAEGYLGGDHEIRFGVDYYTADTESQTRYPNNRQLYIHDINNPSGYKEIWWKTDSIFDVGFKRMSFYLQDTATFGKLTANIGIRYDKETGKHNPVMTPGISYNNSYLFSSYFPVEHSSGKAIAADYSVISPRISLTYDITGDGKNVVKASYARYGSQSGNSNSNFVWGLGSKEIDVYWNDMNGDLSVDPGEFYTCYVNWLFWTGFDPMAPFSTKSKNRFDPDYNSPMLTEITLAYEKAFGDDIAVSLNMFYKKTSNLTWDRGYFTSAGKPETADNWYEAGTYTFQDGSSKPYYQRNVQPDALYRTNYGSGRYDLYKALQLVFSKKFANGWMLDSSFTYSDWKAYYDTSESFDRTNFDFYNEGVRAEPSTGSGMTGIYVNSRWQFKLSGLYQLPWGINLTGVFQAREGYVIPYYETHHPSCMSWTSIYETGKKLGDDRLPTFWMLNLGMEKTYKISDTTTATIFVDGYNITNNSTTLKVNPLIGSAEGEIQRILNPGLFQFGVRVSF